MRAELVWQTFWLRRPLSS